MRDSAKRWLRLRSGKEARWDRGTLGYDVAESIRGARGVAGFQGEKIRWTRFGSWSTICTHEANRVSQASFGVFSTLSNCRTVFETLAGNRAARRVGLPSGIEDSL